MRKLCLCLAAWGLSISAAHAVDRLAISGGASTDANEIRVGVGWDWGKRWFTEGDWYLTGYWEADAGYWQGTGAGARRVGSIGLTPVFRLLPNDPSRSRWHWDFGVGVQVVSEDRINHERHFGSRVLFGDLLGVGKSFGSKDRYELDYRFWHLSNANLADENDGISFHEIRFTWRYDQP